ncbi:hypothetical protein RYX36_004415 [Vicia faba]
MTKPIKAFVRKRELSFCGGGVDGGGCCRTGECRSCCRSRRCGIILRAGGGGGSERSEISSEMACGDSESWQESLLVMFEESYRMREKMEMVEVLTFVVELENPMVDDVHVSPGGSLVVSFEESLKAIHALMIVAIHALMIVAIQALMVSPG